MNAVTQNCPQEFLKDNPLLVIGLDVQGSLRLVLAEITDNPEPTILEHHCFRSIERLQRYMRPSVLERIRTVAMQADDEDPHGVKTWLTAQNLPIHQYPNPRWSGYTLKLDSQLEFWELPRSYQMAYTLAFLTSYKFHSENTVRKLWTQTYTMKEIFDEYDRELSRLSYALGEDGVPPTLRQRLCPF